MVDTTRDELASYEKFDGIGPHAETIETRARIGERYLEAYESALSDPRLAGYTPADCPSELLLDLLDGTALSVPAADGWRDIGSAPKDGTIIDLWVVGDPFCWRVPDAWWCPDEKNWITSDGDYGGPGPFLGPMDVATHWMPLPAAPKDTPHDQ